MSPKTIDQTNSNVTAEKTDVNKADKKAENIEVKPAAPAKKNLPFHQLQHNHRGGKFGASHGKGGKGFNISTRRGGSGGDR